MNARAREILFYVIVGAISIGLAFINADPVNTTLYRFVLGGGFVALTVAGLLSVTLASLRSWAMITKILTGILLLLTHPFSANLWGSTYVVPVLWMMSAGYMCVDYQHIKRFPLTLSLSVIATVLSVFDPTRIAAFIIFAADGLIHIFLCKTRMDRFCAFFLFLSSVSAVIGLTPAFPGIRIGMGTAIAALAWGFLRPGILEMQFIQKENEAIMEQEIRLARIEENAYKAEIRPHFLLNALNNVRVAYHESKEEGRRLLDSLKRLEIIAADATQKESIPIRDEIEIIRRLIDLFEKQRNNHVFLEVDVTDEEQRIPPFLLEPLVENSLQHSGVMTQENGTISISEHSDNGYISIIVKDNGCGHPLPTQSRGIGLSNVQARVALLDRGKMSIYSDAEGTEIEIGFFGWGGV